jgi:hypothetical protein
VLELRVYSHRSTRARRVTLTDGVKVSYGVHGAGLLGDCIKAFQHAWVASKRFDTTIGLYPRGMGHDGLGAGFWQEGLLREVMALFEVNDDVELIIPEGLPKSVPFNYGKYMRVPMFDPFLNEDPVEYRLVKSAWKPGRYNRMCYQFYGTSFWRRQNFRKPEAIQLYCSFPEIEKVKLGLPLTLAQSAEIMRNSDFFVGIDSGMTHLARCIGIPAFVNPQRVPMDWFYRWHPKGSPSYIIFRTLPELYQQLRERLPWVLPAV